MCRLIARADGEAVIVRILKCLFGDVLNRFSNEFLTSSGYCLGLFNVLKVQKTLSSYV